MHLDQALFGYSHGHRRLASSTPLTQSEERLLVRMTDLSGSRAAVGFETYLSGYSLGKSGRYAIAKTWYAPECERPGCVWTQVVFLTPDAWDFVSASELLSLFCRPSEAKQDFEWYSRKLIIEEHASPSSLFLNGDMARVIAPAIYLSNEPVVALMHSLEDPVAFIALAMLWQRPAPLRDAFSFCTGALSFLKIDDQPLRLQIMPSRAAKTLREPNITIVSLDGLVGTAAEAVPDLIARDLEQDSSTYRKFLRAVTEGWQPIEEPLASETITSLSEAFLALRDYTDTTENATNVLRLAHTFSSEDGRHIYLLERFAGLLKNPSASWVLVDLVLVADPASDAFGVAFIDEAAHMAAKSDPDRAFNVLKQHLYDADASFALKRLLAGLLRAITLEFLSALKPIEPQLLIAWVHQHPDALSDSRFWLLQHSFNESAELAEALQESSSEGLVLEALLMADRYDLLLLLLRAQGREGALKAFRLAAQLDISSYADRQRLRALREETVAFAEYIVRMRENEGQNITASQLFLLGSSHLDAAKLLEVAPQQTTWTAVLKALGQEYDRIHCMAFVLAIWNEGWWRLGELAFLPLYERTGRDLPYEDWSFVKRFLPKLAIWEKWDKRERLRRALVDIMRRDREPLGSLAAVKGETKTSLLATAERYR